MALALTATAIVIVALLGELLRPRIADSVERFRAGRRVVSPLDDLDPGRDLRAEARARLLLRSCVNAEEWAMYRDLGFIRVWSIDAGRRRGPRDVGDEGAADGAVPEEELGTADGGRDETSGRECASGPGQAARGDRLGRLRRAWGERGPRVEGVATRAGGRAGEPPCAYLIYPHKPIVAYVPQTGRLLNEYCVEFPDQTRPYGSALLPDSDDVLAKWMALTGDEERLLRNANMHLPGHQLDPRLVKRDLWRLRQWERERARRAGAASRGSRAVAR